MAVAGARAPAPIVPPSTVDGSKVMVASNCGPSSRARNVPAMSVASRSRGTGGIHPVSQALERIVQAHRLHHAVETKHGTVSFGFLWAPKPEDLKAELKRRDNAGVRKPRAAEPAE